MMSLKRILAVLVLLYIYDCVCKQCEDVHSAGFPSSITLHTMVLCVGSTDTV